VDERRRTSIAFFEYHDVFEDFYPHYGIDQARFISSSIETGNSAFLKLIQREIGDVDWYVFSLKPQFGEARHESVGCTVKFLRSSWLHRILWKLFYTPKSAWRWRRAYPSYALAASYVSLLSFSFARTLLQNRPEYLLVQDYATGRFDVLLLIARLLRIRLIARHSGSRPEMYSGTMIKRWTLRRADHIIVSSRRELEMLSQRYGVARERMSVILTPIDTDLFFPAERATACSAEKLDPSRRYVLYVGRFEDRVKRISSIIRVFSAMAGRYPNVDLLLAGAGDDEIKLRQLAEESAPMRIFFLGWVSDCARKARLYSLAECVVLPSRSEGFPTVVGEALACGTPVIATDVGGISELVVDGQTGWLCPPEDDAALLRTLQAVLEAQRDPALRLMTRKMAEERVSLHAVALNLRECFPSGTNE
jgi:glycosyltransferase involved in cell wall biosynthesis